MTPPSISTAEDDDVDPIDAVNHALRHHPDGITNSVELQSILESEYGITRSARQILTDLRVLERTGEAYSKTLGANAVGWIHTDRLRSPDQLNTTHSTTPTREIAHETPRRTPDSATPTPTPSSSESESEPASDPEAEGGPLAAYEADVRDVVTTLDLPGTGDRLRERQAAVAACIRFIRENGEGRKSTFIQRIYPDYKAGYSSERGWWETVGKQGLHEAAGRLGDISAPSEGEHTYSKKMP